MKRCEDMLVDVVVGVCRSYCRVLFKTNHMQTTHRHPSTETGGVNRKEPSDICPLEDNNNIITTTEHYKLPIFNSFVSRAVFVWNLWWIWWWWYWIEIIKYKSCIKSKMCVDRFSWICPPPPPRVCSWTCRSFSRGLLKIGIWWPITEIPRSLNKDDHRPPLLVWRNERRESSKSTADDHESWSSSTWAQMNEWSSK